MKINVQIIPDED